MSSMECQPEACRGIDTRKSDSDVSSPPPSGFPDSISSHAVDRKSRGGLHKLVGYFFALFEDAAMSYRTSANHRNGVCDIVIPALI